MDLNARVLHRLQFPGHQSNTSNINNQLCQRAVLILQLGEVTPGARVNTSRT